MKISIWSDGSELNSIHRPSGDIWPLLSGQPGAKNPHEAYYLYYNVNELQAVRSGKWKLMLPHTYRTMESQEPGKDGTPGRYRQTNGTRMLVQGQ